MDSHARETVHPSLALPHAADDETAPSTRLWARVGVGAAGGAAFLLLASVFDPGHSSANDNHVPGVIDLARHRAASATEVLRRAHPQGWPTLGMLEGAEYLVIVHASPSGPRYTVCNTIGEVLATDLAADDVYRSFPELDIPGMLLDPEANDGSPPMMLADPAN
ncbi:MAG: hypothetical protein IT438_15295 [Phycisphaerales bacterium]|nr:hypothetical protein [Phycisphaerales bacterium]